MNPAVEATTLEQVQAAIAARKGAAADPLAGLFLKLQESEAQMLALIDYLEHPDSPPAVPDTGEFELGFVLYWIHHPPALLDLLLAESPALLLYGAIRLDAPATRITPDHYAMVTERLATYGVPWTDGTIYGFKHYEQLDVRWMLVPLNYALNRMLPKSVVPFPTATPARLALSRKDGDTASDPVIGIVGDWGTGFYQEPAAGGGLIDCPAKRIIDQVTNPAVSPAIDYLLHLGDVYYAGTRQRPWPDEEQDNFLSVWPDQGKDRNFTLNSNHEMYGAAAGYFEVALQAGGPFAAQNGMSYFALTHGPWLLLGLDSAYFSDAQNGDHLYMRGAIGTATATQQIDWLAQFQSWTGPIMVTTHHDPTDLTGSTSNTLYAQVTQALKRAPTLWYWGHVHNGIVYDALHDSGTTPATRLPTLGRCCGHAAIPYGNGWQLETSAGKDGSNIVYYAHTPDPALPDTQGDAPGNPRVRNGYALVTLRSDGGFDEAFYETDVATPAYARSWSAAELAARA